MMVRSWYDQTVNAPASTRISSAIQRVGAAVVALVLGFLVARAQNAGNTDPAIPTQSELARLYSHPLKLPTVKAGETCPVSKGSHEAVPHADYIFCSSCAWFGKGPVYFALTHYRELTNNVDLTGPFPRENGSYSVKTAWVSKPEYIGPILVRVQQLGSNERLKFRFDSRGNRDLQLSAPRSDRPELRSFWSFWPSSLLLRGRGCYGVQIDTLQGSDIVVFQATDDSSTR